MAKATDQLSTWFFLLEFGFWLLTTDTGFNLVGEVQRSSSGEGYRVQFWGKIGMGCVGEMHPSLYRGVGGVRND
jgi:hypothetical protein